MVGTFTTFVNQFAPLIMIGSGLVALVAYAAWWREILLRTEAGRIAYEMQESFLRVCELEYESCQRAEMLQEAIDAAARKRSDASKKGWAGRKERQRALKAVTTARLDAGV